MNVVTENSSEKTLEKVAEQNPISVYSVNFTQIINNNAEKSLAPNQTETDEPGKMVAKNSFSKKIFKWRNAVAVAAILTVGVLHFAYQLSVIKIEKTQIAETPPKIEQVREKSAETKPDQFEAKKVDILLPSKPPAPTVRQRPAETAPSKPQLKKKEAVETRAERLRRAEKLLTGV